MRYRLEHIGLLIAARLVPLLPRPVLVALAKMFGALASLLDRYGRSIALANLDCAFGQKYSAAEKHRIIRESYQHFAQTMLDLMWSPRLTRENFLRYIDLEKYPTLAPNQSGIVVCYHYTIQFSAAGANSPAIPSPRAPGEFYDFSRPCAAAAPQRCWSI